MFLTPKYNEIQEELRESKSLANVKEKLLLLHIEALVRTLEAKDEYTCGHSERVAEYAIKIAKHINLAEEEINNIRLAASLHDLGKIGIKDDILNKNGPLTQEEFNTIKLHPNIGAKILQPIAPVKQLIPYIQHHHERYNGTGYPDGLSGDEIPLGAKIIAIADTYDAMTSDRPYRKALSEEVALKEIEKNSGTQFDPKLVEAWLELQDVNVR
ncbi:HD-GYP domain-containing protein (c-di-GMP phosphodiesterase class II) [Desulfitispora alkaliphila]|uniref:HD-GYP domain-containing protein n=1 Tax=Desulfitispora alkaliphila TaxID=622674 RepID=UPI003D256BCC